MSCLHCHKCGWSQDDYWSLTYNPIQSLLYWERDLLTRDLDSIFVDEPGEKKTLREVIVQEIKNAARRIEHMKFRTKEEAKSKLVNNLCPKCNQKGLDED